MIANARRRQLADVVTYTQGETVLPELAATAGETRMVHVTESGMHLTVRARDYLIEASALVSDGVPFDPKAGDVIVHELEGTAYTFEVASADGGDAWRWHDSARTTYRVHTREVPTQGGAT